MTFSQSLKIILPFAAIMVMLDGCAVMVPGHLYPVQGPLSKESLPPIYTASLNGSFLPSGTLTVHMGPGVSCPGDWKAVSRDDQTAQTMAAEWDQVYGSGFFIADVLGRRTFARSMLSCSNGTKLKLEFLVTRPGEPTSTIGVVTDGAGNLFKLAF